MTFSLNRLELIGRLGHDPEMRYTQDGLAVTKFSVATDRPVKPGASPETDWHQVICWGKTAEFAGNYLAKGRLVYVAGRIAYRIWESTDGAKHGSVEVVALELIALDRRPEPAPESPGFPEEGSPLPERPESGARGEPPSAFAQPPSPDAPASPRPSTQARPAPNQNARRPAF